MRKSRAATAAIALGVTLIVPLSVARADEAGPAAPAAAPAARGDGDEYVVSLAGDASTAAATLEASGAEVLEVNAELGIALVGTTDEAFLADAAASGAITGGARNHSIERSGPASRTSSPRSGRTRWTRRVGAPAAITSATVAPGRARAGPIPSRRSSGTWT